MRIIDITEPGGPDGLAARHAPDPTAELDEVVIAVAAAGVNNADLLQRRGHYASPPGAPPWPGLEVSGTVLETGPGTAWRPGERVVALLDGGGYAERVAVRSGQVVAAPDGVDLVDAAALPEAACTVWSTLASAGLRTGEWLLVHGGSGGVGSLAVQIASAIGCRVLATAAGPARALRCAELGADAVVDHLAEDFVARAREATDGRGVDVVLDVVGAAYLARNLDVLATGGRLAVIGLQKGRRGELDLGVRLAKRATVLGTTLRSRPPAEKAAIVAAVREHVWPLVADGRVRPVIHDRLPLADAARAHRMLESGEVFGKLLLIP